MAALPQAASAQEVKKLFDIPAGPATSTINVFAKQAGVNVLASEDNLMGIQTNRVQGTYLISEALQKLLSGTGLTSKVATSGAVFIKADEAPPRGDRSSEPTIRDQAMIDMNIPSQRKATCCAVSAAVLLMGAPFNAAQAQAIANVQAQPNGSVEDDIRQVLVVGARASEQTSIQRKKNAPTAQDSIVADDIGSFPDRNVAEAISRVAGVSLNRDDYGEGASISVRGNANDLTRVELDGMAVMSAAGNSPTENDPGRGTMLNELPADLIASVDVIKGSTPDMTEGSLGGGVIIKTRTGLDFKKQTISLRASAGATSLNNKWKPNLNLIFADKFLDGRMGIVANLSSAKYNNESHQYTAFANTGSQFHLIDFDNSPEKTFSFQPNSVLPPDPLQSTDVPLRSFARTGTTERFNTMSPRELVTTAAGAQTKEDCYARFPWYSTSQLSTIAGANDRATAQNQRAVELQTCLSQWNDGSPWTVRRKIQTADETRHAADLRADFKVNNNLSVYIKFNRNQSEKVDSSSLFGQGGVVEFGTVGTHYTDVVSAQTAAPYRNTVRTPLPNSGFYLYPNTFANKGASGSTYQGVANGAVINVDPSTVKVDANHNLVGYRVSNSGYGIDTIQTFQDTRTTTTQGGATYRSGAFRAELLAGRSNSEYSRFAYRTNLFYGAGPADVVVTPDGIVEVTPTSVPDLMNPANYSVLGAPSTAAATLGQRRNTSTVVQMDSNIKYNETSESTIKGDFTYALSDNSPFINRLKFGFNQRSQEASAWGPGFATIATATATSPAITVPGVRVNVPLTICENGAPGSVPCAYGLSPAVPGSLNQTPTVTQADFNNYVSQSIAPASASFFDGVANRPAGLGTSWPQVNVAKLFSLTGVPNLNPLDCIKRCIGSDGKMHDQPYNATSEKISAGYFMTDFAFDRVPFTDWTLPFGMELEGNFGWRYVRTDVKGTTSTTFTVVTPANASNPDPLGEVLTSALRRSASFERTTTDIMPALNLAWWVLPEQVVVRYNRAKTIARQRIGFIFGENVNCTNDFRRPFQELVEDADEGATDMSCSGVVGNPGLRPYTNINHNLSVEWYANSDTVLAASAFRQIGRTGAPRRIGVFNSRPFEGTGETDPAGKPLSDVEFKYSTYINGPAVTRTGIELSGKTAFTFLPSVLRYTGISANYTRVRATSLVPTEVDFYTGEALPQRGVQDYSWNASLWYDDGALNMRASLQVTPATYSYMASNSSMANYPSLSTGARVANPPYDMSMAIWNTTRRYMDAKIGYKFKNGIEVFAEGRNLGRKANAAYAPQAALESGGSMVNVLNYGGARYLVGLVLRN